jgi:NADP-dependent 3-hydroxy acid dehydrogenase YdfG
VGHFAATQHAMRALADSLREELNPEGVRITSLFLGRTATARQAAIFEMEQRPYVPETLIQPRDVADLVVALAMLPTTSEVTDITVRPRVKSY